MLKSMLTGGNDKQNENGYNLPNNRFILSIITMKWMPYNERRLQSLKNVQKKIKSLFIYFFM